MQLSSDEIYVQEGAEAWLVLQSKVTQKYGTGCLEAAKE